MQIIKLELPSLDKVKEKLLSKKTEKFSGVDEDDPFYFSEIKKKNEVLLKIVDEKTRDLVQKNRDLEIEASLERVRTVSMSMKNPDDLLDICEILFKELHNLGFSELRNAMINIFNDDKETFVNYDYSDVLGKSITPLFYNIHPIIKKQIRQVRKSKDAYTETVFSIKDLADWKKFRKSRGEKDDPRLKKAKALHYYFYSVGTAAIGISTFSPITDEKKQILKRFRNVFDFAYRRYMDVTQAEAQAREAQIEASLERVRARSMAMHHSNELVNASVVLFNELKSLGIEAIRTGVAIVDEPSKSLEVWSSQLIGKERNKILGVVPFKAHHFFEEYYKSWKKREPYFAFELSGKDVKKYYDLMSSILSYPKRKEFNPRELFYTFYFPEGSLNVVSKTNLSEDECSLMIRFANVFGLIYRRFLDLQKAEVQAREAQIEVALERVRSRTMAMHKSEELAETAAVLFEQLCGLGIDALRLYIGIIDHKNDEIDFWTTDYGGSQVSSKYKANLFGSTTFRKIYSGWKEKRKSLVVDPKGKELTEHLYYLKEIMNYPIRDRKTLSRRLQTIAYFSKGLIGVLSNNELPKESVILLERFAGVFDLTYRRFLDLQKAEDQAHEAQIEVALERVRSRTMAMHSSEELQDTAVLLYQQIRDLGVDTGSCGYIIWDKGKKDATAWMSSAEGGIQEPFKLPHTKSKIYKEIYSAKESGKDFFVKEVKGAELKKHFDYLTTVPGIGEKIKQLRKARYKFPESIVYNIAYFRQGYLSFHTYEQTPEAQDIFRRFANVFEQTYTRFLDLQKAESQAREAQIQLALERVRAKAMAMQKSDELLEVSLELYNQFKQLDNAVRGLTINIVNEKERVFEVSFGMFNQSFKLSIDEQIVMSKAYKCWKSGKKSLELVLTREDLIKFNKIRNTAVGSEIFPLKYKSGFQLIMYMAFFSNGMLIVGMEEQKPEETIDILQRFASVFDLTYTRFLDLQKAEAQTREAQIEAALERVRGKAMAMHNSDDLTEAAGQVFTELNNLGIKPIRSGFVLLTKETRKAKLYPATSFDNKNIISFTGELDFTGHPVYEKQYDSWEKKENYFPVLEGDLLKSYYEILAKGLSVPYENFSTDKKQFGTFLPFSEGFLFTWSDEAYSENEINILDRFKNILDLTIRRYIDLKNAEAQSRESQIEASLERVRSKAMAMQTSDDLGLAVATIFEELDKLDLGTLRCGIGIINKEKKSADVWSTTKSEGGKKIVQITGDEPIVHPLLEGAFDAWLRQGDFSYLLQGNDLHEYYKGLTTTNFNLPDSEMIISGNEDLKQYYYVTAFPAGNLYAFRETDFPEEAKIVMKRFADVINFTYTRFNDLKQAEAQASEAKIEAALERVRAGALIMRKPEDMLDVCKVISEQLILLNVKDIRNTQTAILNEGRESYQNYEYFPDYDERTISEIDYNLHPKVTEFVNEIKKSSDAFFSTSFEGKELQEWKDYRNRTNQMPDAKLDAASSLHYYFYSIGPGALGISTYAPLSEDQINVFKRFRNVFELAYRRYVDIEQAEAQAREARIEAALERVRSRTLAMQKSDELAETAAVLFKQLINLGIEPNRLYIGIINDDSGDIEAWATDEDGSKVSKEFTLNIHANASVKKMYDGWAANKKSIIIDMHGKELEEYFHYLNDVLNVPFKVGLSHDRRVQNIAYFSKGFIGMSKGFTGMALHDPQPEETAILLERFAAVFNLTFTRFNDLQIAEKHAEQAELDLVKLQTEKKRAEEALTELRSTQALLIQSEKMASLGELTAGIAHEIQNPLNFVNNFSEVNTELIDELNQEIEKGNFDEAAAIAKDIKDNEEKIKHHGKRAEGIVKGMLQHSRSSSGVKEPVNINALADEYLRLAYHGLRAKDKTFNAKMETDFDESIGEVNVVPQEIGRVILNLITNAFYAVTEKKKEGIKGYEPTVTVSTKKSDNKVLISVKDNGNGIPQKVMDKIFQPFFTTKPTGEGTGLGLSMSYDIIKAHGGELKVTTKEGEGSEFVILLNA